VHAGKVYTLGISGILVCWDAASGKVVWRKDFAKQFTETSPLYGTATSPFAHEGLVIAHVGGHGKGAMTAFDPATGEVKWDWPDDGPGYASPVVAKLAGEPQLITQTQDNVIALSPTTGKLLWKRRYETEYTQNIITPVPAGELVLYSGYNQPLAALRVVKMEDRLTPQDAWNNRNHPLYMSTPVVKDDRVYGFSQRNSGHVFCVDAKSGKTIWQSDGRLGENASLIVAGRYLLVNTTDGGLYVLRTEADEFLVAAKYQVGSSPTWAHPALVKDRIWVKDRTTLYCLTWK
jgi:outer membrane protein assembly factor BamB